MITYQQATREQLDAISDFIATLNQDRSEQAGWLGSSKEEVLETLSTLPHLAFEDSHITAYENGNLVGVFGFYAFPEQKNIRLLGPHVKHASWLDVTQGLWERLNQLIPAGITVVKGFTDSQNQKCLDFFEALGLKEYNAEAVMALSRGAYAPVELPQGAGVVVQEYTPDLEAGFKAVHPESAFYTADDVLGQLSDTKKIFVLTEDGQVRGYTFAEAFLETGKNDIVFLQVAEQSRNKKYGSLLISTLIQWTFDQPALDEINLSVRLTNPARRLYERLGFEETTVIMAFEKEL